MIRARRKHRGLFMPEVIVALALVTFVMALFAIAIGRQGKGLQRLGDSRAATLLAEDSLNAIQSGAPLPAVPAGANVRVLTIDQPSDVKGRKWATVQARVNGRSVSLVGLVPADAKTEGGVQ